MILLCKLYLTFDTEDFISRNTIPVLQKILESLEKYDMKGLFFITGYVAEKLQDFPEVVDLLKRHEIGYHSSSHSVHPTIYEFTDIEDYSKAYDVSIQRETAHINPLSGDIEGKGGISVLKNLFPNKRIIAFRAPGHCWSPPHLEALRSLGIEYDFSASAISSLPASYKNIVFYPPPLMGHWQGKLSEYTTLLFSLGREMSILTIHPSLFVNQDEWDAIYSKSNPKELVAPIARSRSETKSIFRKFDLFLRQLRDLQKISVLKVTANLEKPKKNLSLTRTEVENCYQTSMKWARQKGYEPKFLHKHFMKFFEMNPIK